MPLNKQLWEQVVKLKKTYDEMSLKEFYEFVQYKLPKVDISKEAIRKGLLKRGCRFTQTNKKVADINKNRIKVDNLVKGEYSDGRKKWNKEQLEREYIQFNGTDKEFSETYDVPYDTLQQYKKKTNIAEQKERYEQIKKEAMYVALLKDLTDSYEKYLKQDKDTEKRDSIFTALSNQTATKFVDKKTGKVVYDKNALREYEDIQRIKNKEDIFRHRNQLLKMLRELGIIEDKGININVDNKIQVVNISVDEYKVILEELRDEKK